MTGVCKEFWQHDWQFIRDQWAQMFTEISGVLLDNFSSKLQVFRQVVLPPSLPVPLWRHNLLGMRCHRVASAIPGTPGTIVLLWHNLLGYVGDVPLLSRELQVAVGSRPSAGALTTAWKVSESLFRLTFSEPLLGWVTENRYLANIEPGFRGPTNGFRSFLYRVFF